MKPLPLNLGYDPECRSCRNGIRTYRSGYDEDDMGGIELRIFCECVEPMPADSACVECGHDREAHRCIGAIPYECTECMCTSFVPVAS